MASIEIWIPELKHLHTLWSQYKCMPAHSNIVEIKIHNLTSIKLYFRRQPFAQPIHAQVYVNIGTDLTKKGNFATAYTQWY